MDLGPPTDVDAARRLVESEQRRPLQLERPVEEHLLLIASAEWRKAEPSRSSGTPSSSRAHARRAGSGAAGGRRRGSTDGAAWRSGCARPTARGTGLALTVVGQIEDARVGSAPRSAEETRLPRTSIVPVVLRTRPPSARSTVLVPDPTCPARPVMILLSSVSDTSSTFPGHAAGRSSPPRRPCREARRARPASSLPPSHPACGR